MKVSMQWIVPVIMGAWAVLTWAHNNDQEPRKERSRLSAQDIVGRERLVEAQNHIVELLSYLEEKKGYTLFQGIRQTCSR